MSTPPHLPNTESSAPRGPLSATAVQITYRHMDGSPALTERLEAEAQKLSRYFADIHRCHVVVEAPPHHHVDGRLVGLHLEISVPGDVLVVSHEAPGQKGDEVYGLVRQVFDAARRRLEDYARRRRGDTKRHGGADAGAAS